MKQSLEEKQTLAMEGLAAGKNCGQLVLLCLSRGIKSARGASAFSLCGAY